MLNCEDLRVRVFLEVLGSRSRLALMRLVEVVDDAERDDDATFALKSMNLHFELEWLPATTMPMSLSIS